MSYIKAKNILPESIIKEIQKYIDGEYIYIPRRASCRKTWGESTKTKEILNNRNEFIYLDYKKGMTIKQLSEKYFLVEKSIQRIIKQKIKSF